ncbi:MFS transporter [Paenibacillus flagellatus]|uniref:MFS transporter n=1 Tax=Paenibacillus flagellatus TaxID=2211139 RepID=A0A2V5KBU2_9BACL|nr:MFS transporter [Paenibacillus flagellatus]PYI56928.1 MFS transporter [Paenibacillus flagellatus]
MDKRIFWLALGSFAIGTEGFMIGGLLPTLAAALHVSTAAAGQLVTAFSLVYAVSSPLLTTLTGRMERRKLLFGSLLLLAVGNVVCGFASSYGPMLAGRIVAALGAGLFSPAAVAAATTLAAPEKRGSAVSVVIAGQTVSLILGVPFGTWVALTFDWRATFWIVGGVTLLAALAIRLLFPPVAPAGTVGMRERLSYLKRPELLSALLTTLAWATGIFSLFTYVSELFSGYGAGGRTISVVLCLCGIASFIGVRTGGLAADRIGPNRAIPLALALLTAALFLLSALNGFAGRPGILALAIAAIALYGFSGYMFNPAQQHRLIGLSGPSAGIVLSLQASVIYVGSALGASAGGAVVRFAAVGQIGYFAGAMTALALAVFAASLRLERRMKQPAAVPARSPTLDQR